MRERRNYTSRVEKFRFIFYLSLPTHGSVWLYVQGLPMTSGPVGTQEQHHRELARLAVSQGRVPLVFLTHDERVAFEEGRLGKLLRRYLVHNTNDNFVVLVAVNDMLTQQEGSKVIGLLIVGPFFSLRDPLYANLSPWSPTEYKGLLEDRRMW